MKVFIYNKVNENGAVLLLNRFPHSHARRILECIHRSFEVKEFGKSLSVLGNSISFPSVYVFALFENGGFGCTFETSSQYKSSDRNLLRTSRKILVRAKVFDC